MHRIASIAALIALACPPVLAQPVPVRDDGLGAEPKFDRKIDVSAEGIPVGDLLAAIAKKTGLALLADPSVADDKVIVFGPQRPLRSLLADIAALYNDSWRHYNNVDKIEQYVLYREPKAFRYENGLAQALSAKMTAKLEQQVAALDETEAQFARRPESDWIRKNFAKPILHGRSATHLYGLLDAGQKQALFSQGYLNVSFTDTGTAVKQTVRDAFEESVAGLVKENARVQEQNPDVHVVIDDPQNLPKYGVRFNLHHENNAGLSALVVQIILGKASYMTMGEFDAESQWMLPPHGNPYDRKPIGVDADLPAEKGVTGALKIKDWIDSLKVLAEQTGKPVLADYYRAPALVKPLPEPPASAASQLTPLDGFAADDAIQPLNVAAPRAATGSTGALDTLCKPVGYLWWVASDGALLVRKRDWFEQQRYEPSDRWMRDIARRMAKQKDVASYGDLAALSNLTPAQTAGLINLFSGDDGTPCDVDTLAGLPELLQVAGALTDPANSIYVGDISPDIAGRIGLPVGGVPPSLRAPVVEFLRIRRQITAPVDAARFRVCFAGYGPINVLAGGAPAPEPHEKVTIVIEWNTGTEQTPFDQRLQLYLPTTIPGDRSSKTRVELE